MNDELIKLIRQLAPQKIAEELVSVQPMPDKLLKEALDVSMSEAELKANGYRPVSHHKLLWIKDNEKH